MAGSNNCTGVCATGDKRAAVPFGDPRADFPASGGKAGRNRNTQIIGVDGGYIPSGGGHDEIVISTGGKPGVFPVSEAVDVIKVAVIPKWAGRRTT
jgi:hypothetical protein